MRWTPILTIAVLAVAAGCENASDRTTTSKKNTTTPPARTTDNTIDRTTPTLPDRTAVPSPRTTPPMTNTPPSAMPGSTAGAPLSDADKQFVAKATSAGMFEVQSSQLVLQQADANASDKEIAQMLIDDHTKANDELKSIVQKKGVTAPMTLQSDEQALLDQLKNASGADMVAQYRDIQVQAHQDAIAMFEKAASTLQDADLKAFAQKTLPTLRKHLDHLQMQHGDSTPSESPNPS